MAGRQPDGDDDLVAGAPLLPPYYVGAAYLWQTGSRFDTMPDAWIQGATQQQDIGYAVSTTGDLDGDGRAELMVSNYPSPLAKYVWVCKYTGVGLQEEVALQIRNGTALRVYPNPCRGRVTVDCPSAQGQDASLRICDISGRVVRDLSVAQCEPGESSRAVSWDLSDNAGRRIGQGVYVIELEQRNGNVTRRYSAKVVVERQ